MRTACGWRTWASHARKAAGTSAPRDHGIQVLGPTQAPLALLRGQHRRRLLLKAPRDADVPAALRAWLAQVRHPHAVRIQVDVDPYSFF